MKFAASIIALYAVAALAGAAEPGDDVEALDDVELLDDLELFNTTAIDDDDFDDEDLGDDVFTLEKRRGCTGHRKTTDVCTGKFLAKMPSRHNCYRKKSGQCCAKNRNGDGGITVSSQSHHGEDCMYCFSGRCKGNA